MKSDATSGFETNGFDWWALRAGGLAVLVLASALVLGCSGDDGGGLDGEGDAGMMTADGGLPARPPRPRPLDAVGRYGVESRFDVASGLPGRVGEVVNTFVEMTDDPTDPATWLLDRAVARLSSEKLRDAIDFLRPGLDVYLDELLEQEAPDVVNDLVAVGRGFGQVVRRFGLVSELETTVAPPSSGMAAGSIPRYLAQHVVGGVFFTIDGVRHDFSAADLELSGLAANGIPVALEAPTRLALGEHQLSLAYGRMLLTVLEQVVIPSVVPFGTSLEDLLLADVDCARVGKAIADYVELGTVGLYQSACLTAIGAVADELEADLLALDGNATSLVLRGVARPIDVDGDRRIDRLEDGRWEGKITFGPLESTLVGPDQKFLGTRMSVP